MKTKEKKIGIMTFWWSLDNYGQLLQAFALQTVLKKMGFSPFLINYKKVVKRSIGNKLKIALKAFGLVKLRGYLKKYLNLENQDRKFIDFRNNYININSSPYRSILDLKKNPPHADYYICGSDQVWNRRSSDDLSAYLLDFGKVQKISYAASFGMNYSEISEEYRKVFSDCLPKFKAVAVREKSGVEACCKLGYSNAVWVPDPTLLLRRKDYETLFLKDDDVSAWKTNKKKILIYTIGNKTAEYRNKVIQKLKNEKEYEVIHVSSQGDYSGNVYPTIEHWLYYMQQADFVLTNSFHGTVFSIIFNKEFAVLPCNKYQAGMNERIISLLEKTNQGHKILDKAERIDELLIDRSDWSFVEKEISKWREEAISFLQNNIQ